MGEDEMPRFSSVLRPSGDVAIEESGLLGTRRGWANINRYEIIFLIVGVLAAIGTDTLTIMRLLDIDDKETNPDFAYGLLILVNSIFLLLFLFTGIWYQRIAHIVAFCVSAAMLTIYVIVHYIARSKEIDTDHRAAKIRLIRLILTIVFNICFIPLATFVIKDYRRDEFSKRIFGVFPAARRPLKIYNIFDCIVRVNTMLSISTFVLNLYNFNDYKVIDIFLLSFGIPLALLWLSVAIGMVRLENSMLVGIFYLISLFQPAFLIFAVYSAIITHSPTAISTTTTLATTMSTISSVASTTALTIMTSTSSSFTSTAALTTMMSTASSFTSTATLTTMKAIDPEIVTVGFNYLKLTAEVLVPVPKALYVCIAANLFTHISSMIFAYICILNFRQGLKEKIFNNRLDKWFQQRWSSAEKKVDASEI
ncbi:unnamed protein product [Rotaria magnacalcarata]|uniref:DUF7789 domain-containing protein n=2 Tax=Rotaria magnacalcarata TaxID=392030 RepID=A0A816QYH6_9BILA|nr:unnamed protein product [Rotaria magnacalcarata]CAF2064682.1 unnamed protein product [Rotaria magnacalcarata]CAF3848007.1 unnamed protein product [Rotaria magnacalcarata]